MKIKATTIVPAYSCRRSSLQNLDWWQLTWPCLVTREPCNHVLNLHPQLLIQYALVSSCGHACLSGKTECLACVSAAGMSYFTACCQIKVCAADHRTGVVCSSAVGSCAKRPGRLSPAPAEWWPRVVQPRKDWESERVIFMFPLFHHVDLMWQTEGPLFPFLSSP